jgi:IclR family transcriptional regulator, acetate operon repressor
MKSVRNAFATLELVASEQPVGVSELARQLGLPKSTVQRAVTTLAELGWIRADSANGVTRWVLTPRALTVGSAVVTGAGFRDVALPVMQELGAKTQETIHLTVPDEEGYVVLIEKVSSTRSVQAVTSVGGRAPIHATSSGLAILAHRPEADIDEMLSGSLESWTELTEVDPGRIRQELERIRERGWAVNPGWWRRDVAAVGAAIVDRQGFSIGAISISTPADRLTPDLHEPYGELVVEAARTIRSMTIASGRPETLR